MCRFVLEGCVGWNMYIVFLGDPVVFFLRERFARNWNVCWGSQLLNKGIWKSILTISFKKRFEAFFRFVCCEFSTTRARLRAYLCEGLLPWDRDFFSKMACWKIEVQPRPLLVFGREFESCHCDCEEIWFRCFLLKIDEHRYQNVG